MVNMKACFSIPNVLTFLKVPLIWSGSMLNNFAPMYVCKTHTFQPRLLWNFEIIVCNIFKRMFLYRQYLSISGNSTQNSTASEVLYAASWICGEFAEHLASPEVTLKALFLSNATNSLPGHILSIYLQNGKNLVSDTLLHVSSSF